MGPLQLEAPSFGDVDGSSRFKQVVATTAAVIVLIGAAIGLLHDRTANREDRLAALAQGEAAHRLGLAVSGNALVARATKVQTEHELLEIRAFEARRQDDGTRERALAETAAEVRALTPLLGESRYESDPYSPARFVADTFADSSRAFLVQAAYAERAGAWGHKADTYVSMLPLFAGALYLIGLSLVAKIARSFFLIVGIALVGVGSVQALQVAIRDVPQTPNAAIEAMVDAQRQAFAGDYKAAVASFTRAIQARPDYGAAYLGRSFARWQEAAGAHPLEPYIEYISGSALTAALADSRAAVRHGATDPSAINQLAALLIHEQRYAEADHYLGLLLGEDDRLALVWTNLGAVKVAQGDEPAAEAAYVRAISLSVNEPNAYQRRSLFSAARGVLDEIAVRVPAERPLAERMASRITAAELASFSGTKRRSTATGTDGEVSHLALTRNGTLLSAEFDDTFAARTPAALVVYYRAGADRLWQQPGAMVLLSRLAGGHNQLDTWVGNCPRPGEYRLDVEVGGRRAASETIELASVAEDPLVYLENRLVGVSLCRPSAWRETQIPDAVGFAQTDGPGKIVMGVAGGVNGVDALIANLADPSLQLIDIQELRLGGIPGRLARYGSVDRFQLVFVAPDGSLLRHFMVTGAVGSGEVADEVVASALFLGVAHP
ncbi:MAG: hypothetical protein ACR2MO_08670 [Acidimicrobiales bacterium]